MSSTLMFTYLQLLPFGSTIVDNYPADDTVSSQRAHSNGLIYTAVTIRTRTCRLVSTTLSVRIINSYDTNSYDKLTTRGKRIQIRLSFAPSACINRLPSPNGFLSPVLEGGQTALAKCNVAYFAALERLVSTKRKCTRT